MNHIINIGLSMVRDLLRTNGASFVSENLAKLQSFRDSANGSKSMLIHAIGGLERQTMEPIEAYQSNSKHIKGIILRF